MADLTNTSIARKLTRMNMFVSSVAVLLACLGFIATDFVSFQQGIVRTLSAQAQVAGNNSVSALVFDDSQAASRTLSAFRSSTNIVSACIYRTDGQPFAVYERDANDSLPARPDIPVGQEERHIFGRHNVILVHTVVLEGKPVGYLLIESDLNGLAARVRTYILIAGLMLGLSLLAALFVSRIARRAIANPVAKLADTARRISQEKKYSIRAERDAEEGELAILVEAFNEMVEQIEERDRLLENRVEERTAQLLAANKELESFSYSVSHDLRAPLRSIDGFSLALVEDYGGCLDDKGRSYIERVRAATQRMGMLIDDLLNLSRVTRTEMRKERVDLSSMANTIALELARTATERDVAWAIDEEMEAFGDSRLLRIVLDNLLGNAWKYTSKHQSARIAVGREKCKEGYTYFVKDDGAGFDPAYAPRLFGAFQRLHGAAEFSGTGVGLATVYRIIQRHGGKVWAEGAVEQGATFYFTL
jgi:signal transduction histidine kinase